MATPRPVSININDAADVVSMIQGTLPYANTHDELVAALLSLDKALH